MRGQPVRYGGSDAPLFGWYHPPAAGPTRQTGVVICPPLGFDYMCLYRSWRMLAEQLAGEGFAVFRFDYRGTGNSAGTAQDPDQVEGWRHSLELAIQEIRARAGISTVSLVGLRLGGTLAASVAATQGGVSSMVLWAPFRSGRAYVRESRALAQLTERKDAPADDTLEAAGFIVTRNTEVGLGDLDLLKLSTAPAPHVLIVDRDDLTGNSTLEDHFRGLGASVVRVAPPGTGEALNEPMTSVPPTKVLSAITAWLGERHPGGLQNGGPGRSDPATETAEQAFYFGPEQRQFGILNNPPGPAKDTAVVFLNTGCEAHIGPHRMYVPLARRLASQGYPVFRYDLGGIGESRPPDGAEENVAYPAHAMDDLRHALQELQRRKRASRFIVVGLCAGGWHAFQAARDGLQVDGVIAVNAPLYLREGPGYTRKELRQQRELNRYVHSMASPAKWRKALSGGASLTTFIRVATLGAWRAARAAASRLGIEFRRDGLSGELQLIAQRRIPAYFIFSGDDLARTYFQLHAESYVKRRRDMLEFEVIDGADHTFRPTTARQQLERRIEELITRRWQRD